MLTPTQLITRQGGIGGSDAAIVLGVSTYKTARQLYHEKRGEAGFENPQIESEEQWWGRMLEPVVRQKYAERTGRIVMVPTDTLRHPVHQFMLAHIDGYTDDGRGYEGKTAMMSTGWGAEGTDAIPEPYLLQVHHYMAVTSLPVFDVATLIGRRFAFYEVPADIEMQEMITAAEAEFMRRVREGDPPPLDYQHRTALDVVKKLYPGTNGKRIEASLEALALRRKVQRAASAVTKCEKIRDAAKAQLLDLMADNALLAFPDGKCYRRQETTRGAYQVESIKYMDSRFINDPDAPKAKKGRK